MQGSRDLFVLSDSSLLLPPRQSVRGQPEAGQDKTSQLPSPSTPEMLSHSPSSPLSSSRYSSTCAIHTSFLFLFSLGYYCLWLFLSPLGYLGFPALTCLWTPLSAPARRQVKDEASRGWFAEMGSETLPAGKDFPCLPPDSSRGGKFVQCSPESLTWDELCPLPLPKAARGKKSSVGGRMRRTARTRGERGA